MKFILVLLIIAAVLYFGLWRLSTNGWHHEISRGEHTGYVTAVERVGFMWKTGRAYLKTDAESSQEDRYCITDPAVYDQLQRLAKSRDRVTIVSVDYVMNGLKNCEGEEGGIITSVSTN